MRIGAARICASADHLHSKVEGGQAPLCGRGSAVEDVSDALHMGPIGRQSNCRCASLVLGATASHTSEKPLRVLQWLCNGAKLLTSSLYRTTLGAKR